MRIVALEEHFTVPEFVGRVGAGRIAARGWPGPGHRPGVMDREPQMQDVGAERLRAMDAGGVTQQVLSISGPGADLLPYPDSLLLAQDTNDRIRQVIDEQPRRFAGFAHLPMAAPEAAADELERAVRVLGLSGALVNGTTQDRFLDDAMFEPILARAAQLDVPIYLHPNVPPQAVRAAYYEALAPKVGFLLSTNAFGWHVETAIHVVRLVVSGAFDRHPGLKVIVGHMGETLPFMLARLDAMLNEEIRAVAPRGVSGTLRDQVWITTSGFFTLPPFLAALLTFGADRILFSVDYPYSSNAVAGAFLRSLPVAETDRWKIAHGNADRLLRL